MNIPWMFVTLYILFIVCLICAAIDDCIDTNQTIRELTEELATLTVEAPLAIELRSTEWFEEEKCHSSF